MKNTVWMIPLFALFATTQGIAGVSDKLNFKIENSVIEYSGGCRESLPAGPCCNAGSQPLHWH